MNKLVEYAGPWASSEAVQEYLGIDSEELARRLENHEVLGCVFNDGKAYYPTRQFISDRVVTELKVVLDTLESGFTNAQTWAIWLAGHPGDGVTHWERLRTGQLEQVLTEARRDASRWSH